MLKELFDGTCRIAPVHMEWKALNAPEDTDEEIEILAEDSVTWEKKTDCLRVICSRTIAFSPECNFEASVSYAVEHILLTPGSLVDIPDEEIDKEINEHIGFYIQENQGLMGRVSQIISQMTSAFGAPPLILPPSYKMSR